MKNKKMSFNQWWMKKNNVPHTSNVRIIASGHNKNDTKFLSGNRGMLQKLQQKVQ